MPQGNRQETSVRLDGIAPDVLASLRRILAEGARECSADFERDAAHRFGLVGDAPRGELRPLLKAAGASLRLVGAWPSPGAPAPGRPLPPLPKLPPFPSPIPTPPDVPYYRLVDPSNWSAMGDDYEIQYAYSGETKVDHSVCLLRKADPATGIIRTALALGQFGGLTYYPTPQPTVNSLVELAHTSNALQIIFLGLPPYSTEALATVQVELDIPRPYTLFELSSSPLRIVGAFAGIGLTISAGPSSIPHQTVRYRFFQGAQGIDGEDETFGPPPFMSAATVVSREPQIVIAGVQISLIVIRLLGDGTPPPNGMAGIAFLEPADRPRIFGPFSQSAGNGAVRVKSVSCRLQPFVSLP